MLSRSDFHDFQEAMVDFGLNRNVDGLDHCAEWAGMGLGKTVVAETVAQDLMRYREISKTLVLTPKTAAQHTWAHEHKQWDHLADLDVRLLATTPEEDEQNLTASQVKDNMIGRMKGGDLHIINPERLSQLIKLWGREWPYDMVVIDDTKGLKRPSSKTFVRLRQVSPKVGRFMITNGTPMPNGYLQLWPQVYILDNGKRLKRTHTDYKNQWFYPDRNGFTWHPRDGAVKDINEKLQDICISVEGKDYMDLPSEERYKVVVDLPPSLQKDYQSLEDDFYLELEDAEIIAVSKGVLYNKLKQFCNGAMYTDKFNQKKLHVLHDLKLDALEALMEELQGENVVIGYSLKSDLARLKARFGKDLVDFRSAGAKARWDKGEIKMLAIHPGSAGHGINLQYGGRTVVWFGSEWSLELNQQLDERIGAVRQVQSGLNMNPRYYHIVVSNSVEDIIADNIADKTLTQDGLREAVKLRLEEKDNDQTKKIMYVDVSEKRTPMDDRMFMGFLL